MQPWQTQSFQHGGLCEPQGYDRIFSAREARRAAARYRKSGLTWAPIQDLYPQVRDSDFRFFVHPEKKHRDR